MVVSIVREGWSRIRCITKHQHGAIEWIRWTDFFSKSSLTFCRPDWVSWFLSGVAEVIDDPKQVNFKQNPIKFYRNEHIGRGIKPSRGIKPGRGIKPRPIHVFILVPSYSSFHYCRPVLFPCWPGILMAPYQISL